MADGGHIENVWIQWIAVTQPRMVRLCWNSVCRSICIPGWKTKPEVDVNCQQSPFWDSFSRHFWAADRIHCTWFGI